MIQINLTQDPSTAMIRVEGKLTKEDYETLIPKLESLHEQSGKLNYFLVLHEFEGWEPKAFWEDLKFDWKHRHQMERIAVVGETKWESFFVRLCSVLFGGEIKYFSTFEQDAAFQWVSTGDHMAASKAL